MVWQILDSEVSSLDLFNMRNVIGYILYNYFKMGNVFY